MDAQLRAGVAIYNAGEYHAAHDAWEDAWLALETDTADERLLHGLIQFTAAVHHARNDNRTGAVGLAESAREYLADLPRTYRGIDVASVRDALDALAADPERIERGPPSLTYEGTALEPPDLGPEATFVAARVLAEEHGFDEGILERGIDYAYEDIETAGEGRFLALVFDFVREGERRGLVFQRLAQHVERRRRRERDVEGLFDPGN